MRYLEQGIELKEYKKLLIGSGSWNWRLRIPLPECLCELESVSRYIHGVPLHLDRLNVNGERAYYQVHENFEDYYDYEFESQAHNGALHEVNRVFWAAVVGPMGTGGIATHAYGSVSIKGHRQKLRLKRLQYSLRYECGSRPCKPRTAFIRLAACFRKRREQIEPV